MYFMELVRKTFNGLIIIYMVGLLSACVPMRETFYEPLADGGETVGRTCHGNAGSRNSVVFKHPDVKIDISAFWERPLVEIHFSMPEGVTLFVPATQFRVTTKKYNELLTLSELTLYESPLNSEGMPTMTSLPIINQLMLRGKKLRWFFLTFPINIDLANEFVLHFPELLANEKPIVLPPITWTLTTEWFILPINC